MTLGGVLIVFGLWWLYFSREAADVLGRAQRGRHRASSTSSASATT